MNSGRETFRKFLAALKRVLRVVCCLIALAGILVIARSLVNAVFLQTYRSGSYSSLPEKVLSYLPFGENYVAPYNARNAEFQRGNYSEAVTWYQKALASDPPERDEECMIRVNLAFSMCHTIDFDHLDMEDQDAVSQAVTILYQARYVLTEHECASEPVGSDDGHFADADSLKHDIDEMLKKLQSQSQSDQNDQSGGGGQDQNQDQGGGGQDQNEDQSQSDDQSGSQSKDKSQEEKEKQERARQEKLKEDLSQQKKDLKKESESSSSYDYEYIDGGDAQGYGDGTLW